MSYFEDIYRDLRFPVDSGDGGLRKAQLGAIHSIAGHFSVRTDPAIVVMPTGSGKTAVLLMTPVVLRAKRALIITPSTLVRGQIAALAANLTVLESAGVVNALTPRPKVKEIRSQRTSSELWEELRDSDFVVATPGCISPGLDTIVEPPSDLFDVVLVDEAHHSSARTWAVLLEHFKGARRVLFTATPFREDGRLLHGRFIFNYPIRMAHDNGIFGNISFVPVEAESGQEDESIAKKAEQIINEDRKNGLKHCLMVRTDSKERANDLLPIYAKHTRLKLRVVHSGCSQKQIRETIQLLKNSVLNEPLQSERLDGIICVAMLGEGFDFPNLKVAAIHTPHHSLGVTLQFIGRFARTGKEGIGDAKFLAVREQLRSEVDILFKEAAIWQEIVANLASTKVEEEIHSREIAETFKRVEVATEDVQDIDLTSFRPYCHVKVYRIDKFIGFLTPKFPHGFTVEKEVVSDELQCALILTKEITRPRWTHYESLSRQESDFFVVYYDDKAKLLFINSSRRGSLAVYDALSQYYSDRTASPLPLPIINRVLANIHDSTWFSVGMKNRVIGSNTESYRSLVGRSADKSVSREDGRLFDRGHISGRGMENGKSVSIGYSRSSKIWSNKSVRVSTLIEWCQKAAKKLMDDQVVATGSNLDYLEVGEELSSLPSNMAPRYFQWVAGIFSLPAVK